MHEKKMKYCLTIPHVARSWIHTYVTIFILERHPCTEHIRKTKFFLPNFLNFSKLNFIFSQSIPTPKGYVTSQGSSTSCQFNFFDRGSHHGKLIAIEKLLMQVLTYTGAHQHSYLLKDNNFCLRDFS